MSNWVTGVACIMVLLVIIVAGFMIASDWIRMAIQQVQLGSFMYEEFKSDKQDWERKKASQEDAALEGGGTRGSSATSPDGSASGKPS